MNFKRKPILGMIHLSYNPNHESVLDRALQEIEILEDCGIDGIIVENYHGGIDDVEIVLQNLPKTNLEIGINILPNNFSKAYELANKYNCSFIQMDYVSGTYYPNKKVNSEDYLPLRNANLNINILGGVWPKYYSPIDGSDLESDLENGMLLSDAIVVTGEGTGYETPVSKILEFRKYLKEFPLIIGAGMTSDNLDLLQYADGAIVGSCFKKGGITTNKIDKNLVNIFMDKKLKLYE